MSRNIYNTSVGFGFDVEQSCVDVEQSCVSFEQSRLSDNNE